ncbi:MAG: hypothetical protein WBN07_09145 [Woeseiaceae bacterium]
MVRRLIIAIVSSAMLVVTAAVASPPFWTVLNDEWCLVENQERKLCLEDATMKRSERHGAMLEVANPAIGSALILVFQYFDSDENPDYDKVDESFDFVMTEESGDLVVTKYRVKLGDSSRSYAEYITITEPSVFSIAIVGGTEEMRREFVKAFTAAWY